MTHRDLENDFVRKASLQNSGTIKRVRPARPEAYVSKHVTNDLRNSVTRGTVKAASSKYPLD